MTDQAKYLCKFEHGTNLFLNVETLMELCDESKELSAAHRRSSRSNFFVSVTADRNVAKAMLGCVLAVIGKRSPLTVPGDSRNCDKPQLVPRQKEHQAPMPIHKSMRCRNKNPDTPAEPISRQVLIRPCLR